jgi:lipid-A-disaccharide synthase
VLAILPFEPAAFERLEGPPSIYVGHPLLERLDDLRPNADEAARRLADPPLVLVLPGSRGSEVRRLGAIFGAALARLGERVGPIDVVLPTLPRVANRVREATADWRIQPRVVVAPEDKHTAFRTARAALAASGTVTLELALAQVPMVAAYRIPAWEGALFRLLASIDTVILANLVMGEKAVPEFLQGDCTPDRLAAALAPLLGETSERRSQMDAFTHLDRIMNLTGERPSLRAAHVVLDQIQRRALPSAAASC